MHGRRRLCQWDARHLASVLVTRGTKERPSIGQLNDHVTQQRVRLAKYASKPVLGRVSFFEILGLNHFGSVRVVLGQKCLR